MTSSFILVSLLLLPATSGLSVSDFTSKSSACASDYSCEASSRTSGSSGPKCRCDKECIIYGDCCYDAPTYDRAKQIQNLGKRQCIDGSYMFNTCPEEWENTDVESLCRNHSPLDIADSRDPVLHLPVTSKITNFTYSNYYCALCHSDAVNIEVWNSKMQCFFTSNNKTLEENTNMLQDLLNLRKNRTTYSLREGTDDEKPLKLIKSSLKFHEERKNWLITNPNNRDIIMECSFNLALNKVRPWNQCSPSIHNCAANWTNEEIENLCLSFSAPVDYYSDYENVSNINGIIYAGTNVEPITYRNMYCAECNYKPIKSPCIVFDQKDTRDTSSPIPPLTVLFHVPNNIQAKHLQADVHCNDNEAFILLYTTRGACILCQIVSDQYTYGKCIEESYDNELHYHTEDGRNEDVSTPVIILGIIILLCIILSIVSLTLHLIAFLLVKRMRNLPGMNLATLSCLLLLFYVNFLMVLLLEPKTTLCYLVACTAYFCFIGSFCWMNVIAFDTWMSFRRITTAVRSQETWKLYRKYSLVSWSLSVFAVASVIALDKLQLTGTLKSLQPKLGESICFLGQQLPLLLFYGVPMIMSFSSVLAFFIWTSLLIRREHRRLKEVLRSQRKRNLFKAFMRLSVSMGLTWVAVLLSHLVENEHVSLVLCIISTLQGVFIFVTFTCRKSVWKEIVKICKREKTNIVNKGTGQRRDSSASEHQEQPIELQLVPASGERNLSTTARVTS